jgi:capsule polysaccharide export protein KpsE/RkpR
MTIEQQLEAIFNTGDPNMQDLANRAMALKQALEQQQISAGEYTEMINDLYHEKNINESVQDLQLKENINTAMNALVNLASMY